jgi:hypothetical protein
MTDKRVPKKQETPPKDRPLAYDEAPAGKEPDGGESILSGRSREDRRDPDETETPSTEDERDEDA